MGAMAESFQIYRCSFEEISWILLTLERMRSGSQLAKSRAEPRDLLKYLWQPDL